MSSSAESAKAGAKPKTAAAIANLLMVEDSMSGTDLWLCLAHFIVTTMNGNGE
ncbi:MULTISPECIES: hypothetical protein [Agrobacterium]|uniref:hypothetical protein n=1 Tax=Agrobacterium TaxID=357 RepID=UPI000A8D6FD6|nr:MULTISPECIES: hypothetical protein [Agrobacterium]MDD1497307.1 hypothetical protein [Agrobacterium sp. CNPSo 3708]